jgi:hypothetical protein
MCGSPIGENPVHDAVLGHNLEQLIPDVSGGVAAAVGAKANKDGGDGTFLREKKSGSLGG